MKLLRDLDQESGLLRGGAVAIGNFDGVHRGHAALVARLKTIAAEVGGPSVVFTFDPPPARLLRPEQAPALLTWTERKAELLGSLGVEVVVAYPTDRDFLTLSAEDFFDTIILRRLAAQALVEGPDFSFGRARSGNISVLGQWCHAAAIRLEVVPPLMEAGEAVSSSRIRRLIGAGDVAGARELLVASHRIRGRVIHGAGRGRTLGYPTANLGQPDTLLPADGIYAGRAFAGGKGWPAAISVGPNPTFGEGAQKVEVYLIGFSGDLYGATVEVDFHAWLREIKRFDAVGQLIAQMNADVAATLQVAS